MHAVKTAQCQSAIRECSVTHIRLSRCMWLILTRPLCSMAPTAAACKKLNSNLHPGWPRPVMICCRAGGLFSSGGVHPSRLKRVPSAPRLRATSPVLSPWQGHARAGSLAAALIDNAAHMGLQVDDSSLSLAQDLDFSEFLARQQHHIQAPAHASACASCVHLPRSPHVWSQRGYLGQAILLACLPQSCTAYVYILCTPVGSVCTCMSGATFVLPILSSSWGQ